MVVVDALAHLHRDRDGVATVGARHVGGGRHRGGHDRAEQAALPRQGAAPALARDLGDRAPEVQVDVVGAVLRDEDPHGARHGGRVHAVELDAARRLVEIGGDHPHRLVVALDQRPRGDHLGDVDAGGGTAGRGTGLLAGQPPERAVRDARHRREHDRHATARQQLHPRVPAHPSILPHSERHPLPARLPVGLCDRRALATVCAWVTGTRPRSSIRSAPPRSGWSSASSSPTPSPVASRSRSGPARSRLPTSRSRRRRRAAASSRTSTSAGCTCTTRCGASCSCCSPACSSSATPPARPGRRSSARCSARARRWRSTSSPSGCTSKTSTGRRRAASPSTR